MSDSLAWVYPAGLAERYGVLLETARVLASTRTLDELYRAAYQETSRVLETSGFYISRFDQSRDLAEVVFYADEGREQPASIMYKGSDSEVLNTHRAVLVDDDIQETSVITLGNQGTDVTRSAVTAPISIHDRVIGAISAQSYRPGAYDHFDLELVQAIADILAVSIDNAEQVVELKRRRREAEKIEEIGRAITKSLDHSEVMNRVVEAVLELLGADGAALWLLDEKLARSAASAGHQQFAENTELELGAPLYRKLIEKEAVVVDEVSDDDLIPTRLRLHLKKGSLIAIPLIVADRATGFLTATSIRSHSYGSGAVNLLKRLGSQASVAMENAQLHARLHALSLTDPLTGLPNRRHLRMHLAKETAAAVRGRRVAVVLFDLDGFKAHNDTHGHLEGDRALKTVAGVLSYEGRAMNLVARFGGDEFISVLSESSVAGAQLYAERVCTLVSECEELASHNLTLSYGIAVYDPAVMDVPDDLIRIADERLYEAKRKRTEVVESPKPTPTPAPTGS
ncbi:MAG: diguanylate cyclase domain-containing protein [Longimicrobiales bacterium]